MPEDAKTCFIIQPLKTPDDYVERYNNDIDHFIHVLEYLHKPAVKKAGFNPIEPIAKGSDLIHAEIIHNLETADLVFCDISCLNPNVFFEMGVRTALNKPICYVKDEYISRIPFDTGSINHIEYKSTLLTWELKDQIEMISDHIKLSFDRSDKMNSLWKHFGLKSVAQAYERKSGTKGQFEEILFRLDEVQRQVETIRQVGSFSSETFAGALSVPSKVVEELINNLLSSEMTDDTTYNAVKTVLKRRDGYYSVSLENPIDQKFRNLLQSIMKSIYGVDCKIRPISLRR